MILKYYNIPINLEDIKKEIPVHVGVGTYMPQLGSYLISKGFDVEIITLNPHLFTNKFKSKTKEELIEYFESLVKQKPNSEKVLNYFINFLKEGGKLTVKIPSIEDIKDELSEKRPVCALVTSTFLLHDKANFNFHFNIITGLDTESIYVNDPTWDERGGEQKYTISEFFFALHASAHGDLDNGSFMKIRLRNK